MADIELPRPINYILHYKLLFVKSFCQNILKKTKLVEKEQSDPISCFSHVYTNGTHYRSIASLTFLATDINYKYQIISR